MKCIDIDFGTYACSYGIRLPYLTRFNWESDENLREKYVSIDKCLLPEILELWKLGIRTAGNCCGHKRLEPTICVSDNNIQKMKDLGYELINDDEENGIFKAKTKLEDSPDVYKECKRE